MRLALAALVCLFLLTFAAPALAWTPPGDRPSADPLVGQAVVIAEHFWAARHVPVCPAAQLDVRVADDLSDGLPWERASGRGELMAGGCPPPGAWPRRPIRVWFLASLVRRAEEATPGNDAAIYLCRTAVLEVAHTGGLDDSGPGLPGGDGVLDPASDWRHGTPWDCRVWANRKRADFRRAARRVATVIAARHPSD